MKCCGFCFSWRKPLHLHAISFTTATQVVMILKPYSNTNGSCHLRDCEHLAWLWNASFLACPTVNRYTNLKRKQLNLPFHCLVFFTLCHLLLLRPLAVLVTTNQLVPHKIQSWQALCSKWQWLLHSAPHTGGYFTCITLPSWCFPKSAWGGHFAHCAAPTCSSMPNCPQNCSCKLLFLKLQMNQKLCEENKMEMKQKPKVLFWKIASFCAGVLSLTLGCFGCQATVQHQWQAVMVSEPPATDGWKSPCKKASAWDVSVHHCMWSTSNCC